VAVKIINKMKHIKNFIKFSEDLKYHLSNSMPITENIFRPGSEKFLSILEEARYLFDENILELNGVDKELYETTDIGRFDYYEGKLVPLDLPMEEFEELNEAEYQGKEVELNQPKRGGKNSKKKYYVYVKDPKTGKVKKVTFGDVKGGLKAKVSDPKARKAFASRHKCSTKKDRTTPGYWACRINKYPNIFGKSYPGFW
jgi:hypothetical protein